MAEASGTDFAVIQRMQRVVNGSILTPALLRKARSTRQRVTVRSKRRSPRKN
jgi:hypothetical protein